MLQTFLQRTSDFPANAISKQFNEKIDTNLRRKEGIASNINAKSLQTEYTRFLSLRRKS